MALKARQRTMAKPIEVTDATFDATLKENPYVLVDFWAEWCGPCRMVAPVMEELAKEYEGKVTVAKLDVDANPQTAMRYRVMSIPTIILFKNGQPVEVMVGAAPKSNFVARLNKHVSVGA
ncbi:thioredoxin [Meiothermus rufus]|uniref:thioredoxin n=1 Tax=Meiothermus rufus TaxID=604332 RepID=UPI002480546B|nr:thioredoxin [Meiothermus rufus]